MKKLILLLMINTMLVRAFASGIWAIEPRVAHGFMPQVMSLMSGHNSNAFANYAYHDDSDNGPAQPDHTTPFAVQASAVGKVYYNYQDAPKGSIAVIPMTGVTTKYDNCGDAGSITYLKRIQEAGDNPNISSILLKADGPGGQVDGTATLAEGIADVDKYKPVLSFVDDGMAASALYWIISSTRKIIASQSTDMIGSIGVYTTLANFQKYYEEKGIKVSDIYAPQSTEKNLSWKMWANENNEALIKGELGVIAEAFIGAVKNNRQGKLNSSVDPFKGKIFFAPEAQKAGLIDGIGNFQYALQQAEGATAKSKSHHFTI